MANNIKKIIAVGSGKGGVGKSTVSYHLAKGLSQHGTVGLLDADIYGPSIPFFTVDKMLENPDQIQKNDELQWYSMGLLSDPTAPLIWRGPMLHKAIKHILDKNWGDLDVLIIDLPPGTGDIQMSIIEKVTLNASILVTQAHPLSFIDCEKALNMFIKFGVPVLGVIENMSMVTCPNCNHKHELFLKNSVEKFCEQHRIAFIGDLPFEKKFQTNMVESPELNNILEHVRSQIFV